MKRLTLLAWIVLIAFSIAACSGKMLVPEDKIDDMQLLSSCDGVNILDLCSFEELNEGTCKVPASITNLWVSSGWGEETSEELELSWKDSTWKMTFDDHKVDLAAFGTYDLDIIDPVLGPLKARVWNFCISNPTPGVHNARYDYQFVNGSRPGNNAQDWTFTVLEVGGTTP